MTAFVAVALAAALAAAPAAFAGEPTVPERPAEGAFVTDAARLLTAEDAEAVRGICRRALVEHDVPIAVATVPSMAAHGAHGWTIEAYAKKVFDTWGLGSPSRNVGILLLVSSGDRRARIELGAEWAHGHDEYARSLLERRILPRFRSGAFSEGIREGVSGLFSLAMLGPGEVPPEASGESPAGGSWTSVVVIVLVLIFVVVRGIAGMRRGRSRSWTPGMGPLSYGWTDSGPYVAGGTYGASSGGGGSFGGGGGGGGGSFGGGFSGGGGASGSW